MRQRAGVVASLPVKPLPTPLLELSRKDPRAPGGSSRSPTKPPPTKVRRHVDKQAADPSQLTEHIPCMVQTLQATPKGGGERIADDTINSGWARHHPDELRPVRIRKDQRESEVRSLGFADERLVVFVGNKAPRLQTYADLLLKYASSSATTTETRTSDPRPAPRSRLGKPPHAPSVSTQVSATAVAPRVAQSTATDFAMDDCPMTAEMESLVDYAVQTFTASSMSAPCEPSRAAMDQFMQDMLPVGPSVDMDLTPPLSPALTSTMRETVVTPTTATAVRHGHVCSVRSISIYSA